MNAITKAGTAAGKVLDRLFPGIALRSADNAASDSVRTIMADYDAAAEWARKSGAPAEFQQTIVNAILEKHGTDQRVGKCFEFAAPEIDEGADPYGVDDEWIDYWRVHAGKAHAADVQAIWGAILAGEVNGPGAVSKRTMSILADMERRDAEAFEWLCAHCTGGARGDGRTDPPAPALVDVGERFAMDPADVSRLKGLGLVDFTLGMGMRTGRGTTCEPGEVFQVGSVPFIVVGDGSARMTLLDCPFTEHGLQLARLRKLGNGKGFAEGMVEHWKSLGFKVGVITDWLGGSEVRYRYV